MMITVSSHTVTDFLWQAVAVTLQQTWHHKVIGVTQLHKRAIAFQLSHLHMICLPKQGVNTAAAGSSVLHDLPHATIYRTEATEAASPLPKQEKWPQRRSNTSRGLQVACFPAGLVKPASHCWRKESNICAGCAFMCSAGNVNIWTCILTLLYGHRLSGCRAVFTPRSLTSAWMSRHNMRNTIKSSFSAFSAAAVQQRLSHLINLYDWVTRSCVHTALGPCGSMIGHIAYYHD